MTPEAIERERIVAAARSWLGTPFAHQGRIKGLACDCVGLAVGVARELGYPVIDVRNYGVNPNPRRMGEELDRQMDRIAIGQAEAGDLIWIAWREQSASPQHLAILTEIGLIHAYGGAPRVVEHPIDQAWRGRFRRAYRFRTG